ncbi:hypothetical protein AgCh_014820 [Apium graveolens]
MAKNLKHRLLVLLLVLIMACAIVLAAEARPLDDAKDLNSKGKESTTTFGAVHAVEAKTAVVNSVEKVSVQGDTDESVPSPGVGH